MINVVITNMKDFNDARSKIEGCLERHSVSW